MVPESLGPGEPGGGARVGRRGSDDRAGHWGSGEACRVAPAERRPAREESAAHGDAKACGPEKLRGAHPGAGLLEIPLAALFPWQI